MQMIPRGPPCVAYVANDLPGLHLPARRDADGLTMGVQGLQAVAVVELDIVAIAAAPASAVRGCLEGGFCLISFVGRPPVFWSGICMDDTGGRS